MDPSYSSYSTYSSYSSYSSYSYSFVDDQDDYPNPVTTATQPFHVASSPQAHYIAPAPESPKREDKKTSPLAEKLSPKQKRTSPGKSGFEFDTNSLNFFSAQTAAAVSAAVSAAINHQINQNILLAPSTSAVAQPPRSCRNRPLSTQPLTQLTKNNHYQMLLSRPPPSIPGEGSGHIHYLFPKSR